MYAPLQHQSRVALLIYLAPVKAFMSLTTVGKRPVLRSVIDVSNVEIQDCLVTRVTTKMDFDYSIEYRYLWYQEYLIFYLILIVKGIVHL